MQIFEDFFVKKGEKPQVNSQKKNTTGGKQPKKKSEGENVASLSDAEDEILFEQWCAKSAQRGSREKGKKRKEKNSVARNLW